MKKYIITLSSLLFLFSGCCPGVCVDEGQSRMECNLLVIMAMNGDVYKQSSEQQRRETELLGLLCNVE